MIATRNTAEGVWMLTIAIILVVVVLLLLWAIAIYNRLVRSRNLVEEGWSGIDVQLKKRADLIPNLVQTVKGYMQHEQEVLERVTELRSQAQSATSMQETAKTEGLLSQALGRLFALAESYPDLKANQNFIELQHSLSEVENSIEMARRYYNGAVRNNNILVESFPSNMVAGMFRFGKAEYFEIEEPAERLVPQVEF